MSDFLKPYGIFIGSVINFYVWYVYSCRIYLSVKRLVYCIFILLKMSYLVTRNVKFIFNKVIILFTSRVVITKLDDECKVIFQRLETCFKKLMQINAEMLYLNFKLFQFSLVLDLLVLIRENTGKLSVSSERIRPEVST